MAGDYPKLVRDRIPEIIRQSGQTPYTRTAAQSELESYLLEKLHEEVSEFRESKDVHELADILGVVYGIARYYGISEEALNRLRQDKRRSRGGFDQNILLEKIE
jgi:predicted house-cleaning noncanonical NTP pyrophosphatase (MazG superfamily)